MPVTPLVQEAITAYENNPCGDTFCVENVELKGDDIAAIHRLLLTQKKITVLDLFTCNIHAADDKHVQVFADMLKDNGSIQTLRICIHAAFTSVEQGFFSALKQSSTLTRQDVRVVAAATNRRLPNGLEYFLENNQIQVLDLSACTMTATDWPILSNAVESNASIREIIFGDNNIRSGMQGIAYVNSGGFAERKPVATHQHFGAIGAHLQKNILSDALTMIRDNGLAGRATFFGVSRKNIVRQIYEAKKHGCQDSKISFSASLQLMPKHGSDRGACDIINKTLLAVTDINSLLGVAGLAIKGASVEKDTLVIQVCDSGIRHRSISLPASMCLTAYPEQHPSSDKPPLAHLDLAEPPAVASAYHLCTLRPKR